MLLVARYTDKKGNIHDTQSKLLLPNEIVKLTLYLRIIPVKMHRLNVHFASKCLHQKLLENI